MSETVSDRTCPHCGGRLPDDAPAGLCPRCLLEKGYPSAGESTAAVADSSAGEHPGPQPARRRFAPPEPSELAERISGLEILDLVGQGGMGAVYRARQTSLDRIVAVKVLPPEVSENEEFAERFTREARALARLNHPHIVGVYDFGRATFPGGRDLFYLVMEYVDGTNLRHVVRSGELAPKEALAIVPQICEALEYAHEEGVVHRDIKPENILLDRKGRVKIADFGLAKLVGRVHDETRLTRADVRVGTPQYMAPEQFERPDEVDHRADIYSLGVVFYEMLTRELPLGRFPPPSARVQVDVRLDEVVLRSLEREPARRYQSAGELRTRVETIRSRPAAAPPPVAPGPEHGDRAALAQVRGPSTGLLVAALVNWVGTILVFFLILCGVLPGFQGLELDAGGDVTGLSPDPPSYLLAVGAAVFLATGFVVYGALKMRHLEGRGAALLAGAVAMVTSPGNLVGFPVGIWAWIVLHRREVREAFEKRSGASRGRRRARPSTGGWAIVLCFLGLATVVVPWAHASFLGGQWTFGWAIPYGLVAGTCSAVLLVLAAVTGGALPRPIARSLLLALGGLALAGTGGWYLREFPRVIEEELQNNPKIEVPAASGPGGASPGTDYHESFGAALDRALTRSFLSSARPHVGPYLAIVAGLGLVVVATSESARARGEPRAGERRTVRQPG